MDGGAVIRRCREALLGGELDAALELMDPALVFHAPKPGVLRGREEVCQIWSLRWRETGGLAATIDCASLWKVKSGRIVEIRGLPDPETARAAVGVPV